MPQKFYGSIKMTYDQRKQMFESMKVLVKPEQEEIFRILRKMKEQYTENSNGIFFDLSVLSDSTIQQIQEYIDFCLKTRHEMDVRMKELETIRSQQESYVDTDE